MVIVTTRIRLRAWRDSDREALAAMHADPEVMRDYGRTLDREQSDAKMVRYATAFAEHRFGRWAVEALDGPFLGYVGLMTTRAPHPAGDHVDIGWRLVRRAWGQGFATEAARAALEDGFSRVGLSEVLAYTAPDNLRSQAVMARLGLRREPGRDFRVQGEAGAWTGLVWTATAPALT